MMRDPVVIDANILISMLVAKHDRLRRHFSLETAPHFYSPKFIAVELFKHKERIAAASALEEDPLLELLHGILSRLHLYDEALIELGNWVEAIRLCHDCDLKDTPYVALALQLMNADIWTRDNELMHGLQAKGFHRFYHSDILSVIYVR